MVLVLVRGPGRPIMLERGSDGMSTPTHPEREKLTNMLVTYLFATNMFVTFEE